MDNSLTLRDTETGVVFSATASFYDVVKVDKPNKYVLVDNSKAQPKQIAEINSANKPPKSNNKAKKEVEKVVEVIDANEDTFIPTHFSNEIITDSSFLDSDDQDSNF